MGNLAAVDLAHIERAVALGQLPSALQLVDAWLAGDANDARAWHVKGGIHAQMGDKGAAMQCFNQAMQRKPDFEEACFDLALTLEETGQLLLAIQVYGHLVQIAPGHRGAGRLVALRSGSAATQLLEQSFALGNQLLEQGRNSDAVQAYQQALSIRADVPEVLANLGTALMRLWRFADAEHVLLRCVALRPELVAAWNTLGNVYKEVGAKDKALEAYRKAVELDADYAFGWVNLGKLLQETGDHTGAARAYEKAFALNAGHAEALAELLHRLNYLCRWEKRAQLAEGLEATLVLGVQSVVPFIAALYCTALTQRTNAEHWSRSHYPQGVPFNPHFSLPSVGKKLRIGYVSADFHRNVTAFLISELFERHDRGQFEIYAYSAGADDGSAQRKRIAGAVDVWRDIHGVDDERAAQMVREDGIDILVDLKGYTFGHRMGLMALRPAPIAVHYLGYPGTTGAGFMDYFIADSVCAPKGAEAEFSEALVRLPHCYQINDRKRALPSGMGTRAEYGLPETGIVFCDFNQSYKFTPEVFAVWMRLLEQVPGSVLWLYETMAEATVNVRAMAVARGIAPERIIVAKMAPPEVHLQRYAQADIFLDTFPVCGHTTASDALWCGVPVVTMAGETFASRVAASLLAAVDLPELVAEDLAAYEALALALARDAQRLAALKNHLREKRMEFALFDTKAVTKALEDAYQRMAARHRAGGAPEGFSV